MLAYVFWHVPSAGIERMDDEVALLAFQAHLAHAPPSGLRGCTTYRICEVPWLGERPGDEQTLGGSRVATEGIGQNTDGGPA